MVIIQQLAFLPGYISWCMVSPMSAPVCRPFWISVMWASFCISLVILSVLARTVARDRARRRAADAAESLAAEVNTAEIARLRWREDSELTDGSGAR